MVVVVVVMMMMMMMRKPWKACSRWSWLRLMDSHLEKLRSKPTLLPSALNNSISDATTDLIPPSVMSSLNPMDNGEDKDSRVG